jgi:hypothetical protein
MYKPKAVISLFDLTGVAVQPWADAGYDCFLFDIQHTEDVILHGRCTVVGGDASTWAEPIADIFSAYDVSIILGFPPCTDLCVAGNRWRVAKAAANPRYIEEAMSLVYLVRDYGEQYGVPYMIENPIGLVSSEWRKPDYMFQPHQMGGYLPEDDTSPHPSVIPPRDAYTKKTCLWTGNGFRMPEARSVTPVKFQDKNGLNYSGPAFKLGGKSLRTKNIRSATPRGFAKAVFEANGHD